MDDNTARGMSDIDAVRLRLYDATARITDLERAVKVLAEECAASEKHDGVIQDVEPRLDQSRLTLDDRGRLRHALARLLQAGQARALDPIAGPAVREAMKEA